MPELDRWSAVLPTITLPIAAVTAVAAVRSVWGRLVAAATFVMKLPRSRKGVVS